MPQSSPSSPAPVSGRHGRSDGMVTRQHLMDVAGLLIAERGFDATTSKQICEAAGVNMASINYHFGSREALYAELLVQAHSLAYTPLVGSENVKNPEFLELFRKSRRDVAVSKQLTGMEQMWSEKARANYERAKQLADEARGLAK